MTGSAVAFLSSTLGDFGTACDEYATRLEKKRVDLGNEETMEGLSLNAGIVLSLEFLQDELLKRKVKTVRSMSDLYVSLCVLENQAMIPVSVFGRLWELDRDETMDVVHLFCELSLATLRSSRECSGEAGILLHDLQLDFCQQESKKANTSSLWHAQLLSGYVAVSSEPLAEESSACGTDAVLSFAPRPWWSPVVLEDGYIHANPSRHLSCAGLGIELAALLLEGRWTELRGRIGGFLALKTDFLQLEKCLDVLENSGEPESVGAEVERSFKAIFKAVQLSWGRMATGLRLFQFQVCGRLESMRKSSVIVVAYLQSVEECTPESYLVPVGSFFPELDNGLIMKVPVGDKIKFVASSLCGRCIAAGTGSEIVILQSSSGEVLQRMRGHTEM